MQGKITKHHILYPHKLWQSLSGADKKRAAYLRGKFIIKLPEDLHALLHKDADPALPDVIGKHIAPSSETLAKVYLCCRKAEDEVEAMTPAEKLEWLIERFDDGSQNSGWLLWNLRKQRQFLREMEGVQER